jgi:putative SOS response-associated peptidase YedK
MCNRYRQAPREKISPYRLLNVPIPFPAGDVFPRGPGSFIRQRSTAKPRELVAGQWGLVPHFAKTRILPYSTNSARYEGVKTAASFKTAMEPGSALPDPGRSLLGTVLGIREERVVGIPPGGRRTLDAGRALEHLD